jgi:hypothetical protein
METVPPQPVAHPDGIPQDLQETASRGFTPLAFAVLGGVIAAGLSGMLGGDGATIRSQDFGQASLTVRAPDVLRNGEFFEMHLLVKAQEDIADLVIAVEPALWRDITINSHIPAPAEESFEDGAYSFHHGPLAAGDQFEVKFDGQVNPTLLGGTAGVISLREGEVPIGDMPMRIRVLP